MRNLFALTPRRYGGPIVHAGMIVLLVGIALNVAFKQGSEATLKVGETSQAGGYTVTFNDLTFQQQDTRFALIGSFDVRDPSGAVHTIEAQQVTYNDQQNVTEVGIDAALGADLYVVMNNADPGGQVATVQFFVEPGVFWLWLGMVIVLLGGIVAAWPRRPNMQAREVEEDPDAFVPVPVMEVG